MADSSFEELFRRYYKGEATVEEKQLLFQIINESADDEKLIKLIQEMAMQSHGDEDVIEPGRAQIIFQKVLDHRRERPVNRLRWWGYVSAAAVLMLLIGTYWLFTGTGKKPAVTMREEPSGKEVILPGGNKAILTLANGKQIVLDSVNNGHLIQENGIRIIKLEDGKISYQDEGNDGENPGYNTITTPVGGQFQVLLADGSKVWLNAASSLRFPARFSGTERIVELEGEGYFEIARNASRPFKVMVNDMNIEVLGTQFNMNAYSDEPEAKTTLLEGKLRLVKQGMSRYLQPRQQAVSKGAGRMQITDDADVEEAVAWKNGKFVFNGNDIHSVMRQLCRWYNIEVDYHSDLPNDESFVGVIPRSANISAVLNLLQKTRTLSFKTTGRKVTVMPYTDIR